MSRRRFRLRTILCVASVALGLVGTGCGRKDAGGAAGAAGETAAAVPSSGGEAAGVSEDVGGASVPEPAVVDGASVGDGDVPGAVAAADAEPRSAGDGATEGEGGAPVVDGTGAVPAAGPFLERRTLTEEEKGVVRREGFADRNVVLAQDYRRYAEMVDREVFDGAPHPGLSFSTAPVTWRPESGVELVLVVQSWPTGVEDCDSDEGCFAMGVSVFRVDGGSWTRVHQQECGWEHQGCASVLVLEEARLGVIESPLDYRDSEAHGRHWCLGWQDGAVVKTTCE